MRRRGHGRGSLRSGARQRRVRAAQSTSAKCRWTRSTRPPSSACASSRHARSPRPRPRADPARRDRPPVARAWTTSTGSCTARTTRCAASASHIEVWVANDLAFPAGDCRTQIATSTTITDAQVAHLISEFDSNMYPKETSTFSTPPDRDGTNALLGPDANGNGGVYTGGGDKTVALIDNVRDDNFYTFPAAPTYIAGFFSSQFNELLDRNVMTIDAFDWLHRTTANPPDEPTADLCTSRPARPNLYEGTFAHEWQHLLHYYTDPFETTWVNEGLSDFAQTLTGYVDATATVFDRGADSHIYCFQGFGTVQTQFNPNPRDCGGPENSLNLWGEGNPNAVLADYGNAYSLMLFLFDRYGTDIISRLHHDGELQGLPSLEAALKAEGAGSMYGVIHDFQSMVLLDKIVGDCEALGRARRAEAQGDDAEPALDGQPGQPERQRRSRRRTQRRRLRRAAGRRRQGAEGARPALADVHRRQAAAVAPAGLDHRDRRSRPPGQPGAVVGQRQQHRRLRGHRGDRADGRPDAEVPRQVRRGVRLRLRLRAGVDGRRRHLHDDPRRQDRRCAAGAGPQRDDRPASSRSRTTCRPTPARASWSPSATSATAASTRVACSSTTSASAPRTVSDGSSLAPFKSPTQIHPIDVHNWNVRLVGIDEGKVPVGLQVEFNGRSSLSAEPGGSSRWPARSRRSSPSSPTTSRPSRSSSTRRTPSR